MYCPSCGKEIKEGAKFCGVCGATLPGETTVAQEPSAVSEQKQAIPIQTVLPPKPKKANKKAIALFVTVAVIALAVFAGVKIYDRPAARLERAINDGNISEAYTIYDNELNGTDLSDKVIDKLNEMTEQAVTDFEAERLSYLDARDILFELRSFINLADAPTSVVYTAIQKVDSINNYKTIMKSADTCFENGEYIEAGRYYRQALEANEGSAEAEEGLEKSADAYRNDVLDRANKCLAAKEYDDAQEILSDGLYYLRNDKELVKVLNGIDDLKIKDIVDEAYSYTDGGKWDSALELLEEAQSQFENNAMIEDAYNDIRNKMPITLKNIVTVASDRIEVIKDVVKDRYGNIYDGAVRYSVRHDGRYFDAYGLYNLNGKYKCFTATFFADNETRNESSVSLAIYLDEELVYFADELTNETAPFEISLDITNRKTMRIIVREQGSWHDSYYCFGNSSFEKVISE